ncbi:MAG: SpoIVB peptidase [Ruminococcus sp.]|nr:SpoIVB peptidase [Ruminococcus sp.]
MVKKHNLKTISFILAIIFSVSITAIPAETKTAKVIIGGEPFGLKLYCKGVMVLKLESFVSDSKKVCPAMESGIEVNDIIIKSDNKIIKSNEQFSRIIKMSQGKPLKLRILRNNKVILKTLSPKKNRRNVYYSGMWIRDSCAGLGTISYYNTATMTYGALGHGICDIDTGGLMQSSSGEIISASITSANKSKNNNIGTLNGFFTDKAIGTLTKNTPLGIYGKLREVPTKNETYYVAEAEEIRLDDAYMYSTVKGETPQRYKIRIIDVCSTDIYSNRNLIIRITDKKLLNKTNGIVQGMSGSPIVQNNKFIGALTHVFIDDCSMGYAVLGTNMLKN